MTKIINLNSLVREPLMIIEIGGVRHPLVPANVDTFIANMKGIESLALDASPVNELNLTVDLISRAFPSLTVAQIRAWSVDVIQQLAELARGANGEIASNDPADAEAAAAGNAQPAK